MNLAISFLAYENLKKCFKFLIEKNLNEFQKLA